MRLFSQLAQDCELKVGKVIWVAGHSGPETAEDSRTHFGIYETGVTQLFPEGHVIDLHPWEYNEVPVRAGRGAGDRCAHRGAAPDPADGRDPGSRGAGHGLALRRGARRLRAARRLAPTRRRRARSTCRARSPPPTWSRSCRSSTRRGINVRIVAGHQPAAVRHAGRTTTASGSAREADRWDGMAVTNRAFKLMRDWVDGPLAREYSLIVRLGRPLAHRRHGRRGDGRGAPGPGPHLRGHPALRRGPRRAPSPAARRGRCHRRRRSRCPCPSCAPIPTSTSARAGPRNLPRRTQPPPERQSPPDLRYLIYVGIALAAVLAALFTPYLIAYLLQAMNGG